MTGDVLSQAAKILKRIWGDDRFRGTQEQIVRTVAEGQHALVLMPTGGGKSLFFSGKTPMGVVQLRLTLGALAEDLRPRLAEWARQSLALLGEAQTGQVQIVVSRQHPCGQRSVNLSPGPAEAAVSWKPSRHPPHRARFGGLMFEDQQRKPTGVRGAQRAPDFSGPAVQPRTLPPRIVTPQLQRQAQVGQQLAAHTFRPMALQRQRVGPVLEASSLQREVDEGLQLQRQVLQAQVSQSRMSMSNGAIEGALERQAARHAPVLALRQAPVGPADWVQAARVEVQWVTDPSSPGQTRWLSGAERERHLGSLRSVSQGLVHGFKADRGPAVQRYAEYGEQLATLQRQPLTSSIPRMVLSQVSPAERPLLQRAVDEALQRQAEHEAQDQSALNQHALQRQLAELDHQAELPIMERIQARRGGGAPLPAAVQRQLEVGLNHDLSGVRVHTDGEADLLSKKVNAVAFTTGQDIYFQSGRFDPNSKTGIELLAHEATHTVQQSRGQVGKGIDPDAGLEQEARSMGHKIAHVLPSSKSLMSPSPHAPGVYSQKAALQRTQDGAAGHFALKPLHDLQPQTIQRFGNPLSWVADKAKEGLASVLTAIPGYHELSLAFGKNLVTGKTMAANPNAVLDALAGWVPGPLKDILSALKETNALPNAWAWFKAELGKLNLGGALSEVAQALGKADLGKAKSAITSRIGGLKALIVGSARKIAEIGLTALAAGLGPVGQQVVGQLRQSGDLILQVFKNPAKFAGNLLNALKGGFSRFAANAPKHLQNGLGQWLTGASGIAFPAKLDLQGVFMTALSVMGLTYQVLRGKLVRSLGVNGEKQVRAAEGTLDTLKSLKGGLQKADELKTNQAPVASEVVSGLKTEVTKSVVTAGITKVASMLIPGGGFVQALLGAFRSVQFLVEQGRQIMGVVTSAVQSVGAIAAGNISAAVAGVEGTLARSIPVALGFLGKVLSLGNIGSKIKAVIARVRGKLDALTDRVVSRLKKLIGTKSAGPSASVPGQAKAMPGNDRRSVQEKKRDVDKAVDAGTRLLRQKKYTPEEVGERLESLRQQYQLKVLTVVSKTLSPLSVERRIHGEVNPTATGPAVVFALPEPWQGTRKNPLSVLWPKPATKNYPTIYLGGAKARRLILRSNTALAGLVGQDDPDVAGTKIRAYRPHQRSTLSGGETIGLSQQNQVQVGKLLLFDASQSTKTSGGETFNKVARKYGMNIKGSNFNADHVLERQLGGTDTLNNLWPLDAGVNGSGGSTLHHMQVELTPGIWSKMVDMKNTSRKYFLKVASTL